MLQSKLFPKTKKQAPKDAMAASHKFLTQAGYIQQLAAGVWTLLPLGFRVYKKIENIIREEINNLGAQEIFMPALQPKELWKETGRWEEIDPPLFKFQDRHKRELALGSTHEEVVTDLARKNITSYKELPFALYQIQNKFRNEMRATSGLLRTREFIMKDLYSFHASKEDLDKYYKKVCKVYLKIYKRCGLKAIIVEASSGTIGGKESHEFMILADSGEDTILICPKCKWAANIEVGEKYKFCPKCKRKLIKEKSVEVGHIFKLGEKYSKVMGANFVDKDGKRKSIVMGCYGIGLERLMAVIVESSHDDFGIIWPKTVAPFDIHLLRLSKNKKIISWADKVYNSLQNRGFEVLYDERDESAGRCFDYYCF